jgi:hypothetical protein
LAQFLRGIAIEIKQQSRLVMTHTSIPETPDPSSASQGRQNIDQTRRKLASAGLGGSAVLLTLVSRSVLADVCPTPSAAGSGNASQHGQTGTPCTGLGTNNPGTWVRTGNSVWPGQIGFSYKPNDDFHPLFTASTHLNVIIYKNDQQKDTRSMTLNEVLDAATNPVDTILQPPNFDMGEVVDGYPMAAWFAAALLGAATGLFGNPPILKPEGVDPSVRGIEDEYARTSFYQFAASKSWGAAKIVQYFRNPWSLL